MANVLYKERDDEAFRFALNIKAALIAAGWNILEEPHPISKDPSLDVLMGYAPGVRTGVTILFGSELHGVRVKSLEDAFMKLGHPPTVIGFSASTVSLPTIIVGPKPAIAPEK